MKHGLAGRSPDSQFTVIMYKASAEIFVFSSANFSLGDHYCFPKALGKDKASPIRLIIRGYRKGRGEEGDVLNIITDNSTQSSLHYLRLKCIHADELVFGGTH